MKILWTTTLGSLLLLLFTGCDSTYEHVFIVENGLSEPITVEYMTLEIPRDSLYVRTIEAHQKDTIARKNAVRGRNEDAPDTYASFDEMTYFPLLRVRNMAGDTSSTPFRERTEWTYTLIEQDLGQYDLYVDTSDF
ncbi:MAG: hypothetical protein AB7H80_04375 [Candidatus Kapaibacterium sp.]